MSADIVDRVGNRHSAHSGQFTGQVLAEADATLLGEPYRADIDCSSTNESAQSAVEPTSEPLKVLEGRHLVADIGFGLEELLVWSKTDLNGTRFLQRDDGTCWEVHFTGTHAEVTANPQQLHERTWIANEGHRVGIRKRCDYRTRGSQQPGIQQATSLHLVTCPQLDAESETGYRHDVWTRQWMAPRDVFVIEAIGQHRRDPGSLCNCLRPRR